MGCYFLLQGIFPTLVLNLGPCIAGRRFTTCNAGDLGLIPGLGRSPGPFPRYKPLLLLIVPGSMSFPPQGFICLQAPVHSTQDQEDFPKGRRGGVRSCHYHVPKVTSPFNHTQALLKSTPAYLLNSSSQLTVSYSHSQISHPNHITNPRHSSKLSLLFGPAMLLLSHFSRVQLCATP